MEISRQGELTLADAAPLRAELMDSLAAAQPVVIRLEAVTEVHLACLQVLLAARRAFSGRGVPLEIRSGDRVRQCWTEAGYPAAGGADCRKPS